jgi:predicted dehydrogenase
MWFMATFRGSLVGCGFFAQFQMEAWNRLGRIVTAVCDIDEAKASAFAEKYGVANVYTDFDAMLDREKPDFLDIVTRPEQHLPMAGAAAERGVHVFCQKPFAPSIPEAQEIIRVCREAGVRLMVNENFRFQGWYREIRRLLDAGAIGQPFSFRWLHRANDGLLASPYPNQPYFVDYPRFLIYETLVHYLDSARYLFGEPSSVSCAIQRVNPKIAGEDMALITLQFPGTLAGTIDGNRCSPLDEEGAAMGNLRIDGLGGTLWMRADGTITVEPRSGERREHTWDIPTIGYRGDACYGTQKHFLDCLSSGAEFETPGEDYLKTMSLVEACYASAAEGRRVTL